MKSNKRNTNKFRKSIKNKNQKSSNMKNTMKNGEMVKEVTNSTNERLISFNELRRISDENFGRFNRNVNHEVIQSNHPDIEDSFFSINRLIEHFHFMGESTEKHYRCLVQHPMISVGMYQDVSLGQWESIQN